MPFEKPFNEGDLVEYEANSSSFWKDLDGVPGVVQSLKNLPGSPHYWNVTVRYMIGDAPLDVILDHRYLHLHIPSRFSDELLDEVAYEVERGRRYPGYSDRGVAFRALVAIEDTGIHLVDKSTINDIIELVVTAAEDAWRWEEGIDMPVLKLRIGRLLGDENALDNP